MPLALAVQERSTSVVTVALLKLNSNVAAEDEHATLVEINVRSSVRKSIADLARELKS